MTRSVTMNLDQLKSIVHEVLRAKAPHYPCDIDKETVLGAGGLNLDSIGCLEVVLMIEKRTGIQLRNENLTTDVLQTAGGLIEFLKRCGMNS